MATYTSIINQVLVKLRESTVAGPTSSDYAGVIGAMVNETKRECEDAWKWTALRSTMPITTAAGTSQYAITGAGKRFKPQSTQHSVYDATNLSRLYKRPAQWMKEQLLGNTNQSISQFYYFEGFDASEDPYVNLMGIPDGIYTINFELVVPQADFSVGTEILSIPDWPVVLGTYAKAIAERGEDAGNTSGEAAARAGIALQDAIAIDISLTTDETTWEVE